MRFQRWTIHDRFVLAEFISRSIRWAERNNAKVGHQMAERAADDRGPSGGPLWHTASIRRISVRKKKKKSPKLDTQDISREEFEDNRRSTREDSCTRDNPD